MNRQILKMAAMVAVLAAVAMGAPDVQADVGEVLRLQGRLLSKGGPVPDGDYGIAVRFYKNKGDDLSKSLYTYISPGVKLSKGVFSLSVGEATKLKVAPFASGEAGWVGIQVGSDPEMPRLPLHQVPYALRAKVASSLSCTGCVGGTQLDVAVLEPYAKKADLSKVATSGKYADLTGGPNLAPYAKKADLHKVATSGVWADLKDKPALAKLVKCPAGEVLAGFGADGVPVCVKDADTKYSGKNFALSNLKCGPGYVSMGVTAEGKPLCTKDVNTTYSGKNFALSNQKCASGYVSMGVTSDGKPICVKDKDTNSTYSGKNFALSNQKCVSGYVSMGVTSDGKPICVKDKDTNSTYSGKNFALSNQKCASGYVSMGVTSDGKPICVKDKDTNSTYSGKNFALSNQNCGSGYVMRGVDSNGKKICAKIAYENPIAAGSFNSTEVNNLKAGKLDNGTTPWTSGLSHNHTYNVNDPWLQDNGLNANFKIYGGSKQVVFRTNGTSQYASGIGSYPFVWMYGGDASGNRRMLLSTNGDLWTSSYGWLHDKFQPKGSYALANKSCATGTVQRGTDSSGNPLCHKYHLNMQNYRIYNLGTPSGSNDAATKGYVDGKVVGLPGGQAVGKRYTVVLTSRYNYCPSGFKKESISTISGPGGNLYVSLNEQGVFYGGMNSWGGAQERLRVRIGSAQNPGYLCTRTYTASAGNPHISVVVKRGSDSCPSNYVSLPAYYMQGKSSVWSYLLATDAGAFIGYRDDWSYDQHGYEEAGGYIQRHWRVGTDVNRVCFRVMGVDQDSSTANGVYPVFMGVHNGGSCPSGYVSRTTSTTNDDDGYLYLQATRSASVIGGMYSWGHGGASYQTVHFHYTHVGRICWKYYVRSGGQPYYQLRTPHTGSCPSGYISMKAAFVKGWNNNGYIQSTGHAMYIGGLYSWGGQDLRTGYLSHNYTGEVNNVLCLKMENVK